jgi:hypothetical protein
MPSYHPPNSGLSALPIVRCARWLAQLVRRPSVLEALSWLVWLLAVAAFAVWMGFHYRAPSGPDWIGMTIRTGVFAIWTQVVREWLMLHVDRRRDQYTDRTATHRWENDD